MSSTRVDFYLLEAAEQTAALIDNPDSEAPSCPSHYLFACRLLEKAYLRGHQVFVYCNNQQEAEGLDELLWTFKENSFIPHNLQGEGPEKPPPIQIGYEKEPHGFSEILLNLADSIPDFWQRFQRIMEIVPNEETAKERSRDHYKVYRANRCLLQTHSLSGSVE